MYRKIGVGITALFLASPVNAAESKCDIFAHQMIGRVISIFHDKTQNEIQKRQALTIVFQDAVDTDWIGKFVLGRFWKITPVEEQKQYLEKYRSYLTQNYISKFDDENGLNIDDIKLAAITPGQPNQFEAKTLIQHKGEEDVHVDYLLDDSSPKCQVHDIKVEGVSLLATQRSEFQTIAETSGVKGIIGAMDRKHNAQE